MKRRKAKHQKSAKTESVRAEPNGKRANLVAQARRATVKKEHNDFADALMAAAAQALGLTIDPAWREGVKFHLRLVLDHAARVDEFPLPDDAEPAPVFHA
jgi:Protein of unknown function (DUF4089)